MGDTAQWTTRPEELPHGDLVRVMWEQHARIRSLCSDVMSAQKLVAKTIAFDELRGLLAVHEAAEQVVVRPRSRVAAGESLANDRDAEEEAVAHALVRLEGLPIDGSEFDARFVAFARSVVEHFEAEETTVFPRILIGYDVDERRRLGTQVIQAERRAPIYPHPRLVGSKAKQLMFGPFAALLDLAKEALSAVHDAPSTAASGVPLPSTGFVDQVQGTTR